MDEETDLGTKGDLELPVKKPKLDFNCFISESEAFPTSSHHFSQIKN